MVDGPSQAGALGDLGIVAGGQALGTQRDGSIEQDAELEHSVALDAGVGRGACKVGLGEVFHDCLSEGLAQVQHVKGDAKTVSDGACIQGVVQAAAVTGLVGIGGIVQLHVHSDDLVALLVEQSCHHAGVHATTHRCNYPCHDSLPRAR